MIARAHQSLRSGFEALRLDDTIANSTRALRAHQLRWWETHSGDPDIGSIDTDVLRAFQTAASKAGLAADTIETSINFVMHVLRSAAEEGWIERAPKRPKRLVSQPTKTRKISLTDFDKFLSCIPEAVKKCRRRSVEWWLAFWAMIYFTALRRANVEQLQASQIGSEVIEVRQLKTGVLVQIPIHPILRRMVDALPPAARPLKIDRKSLYRITTRACKLAGVVGISPQSVRALSARQFERAHPGSGRLILGRPFPGADQYYFDAPEILRSAIDKLAVPPALMTQEERDRAVDSERIMLTLFRLLSRDDQATVMTVACSLRK